MDTLVSIIMPAYNAEKYISEAVESVLSQTYQHWELLIINDGSTDQTENIARKYAEKDPRIVLINQANKKLAVARNTGIQSAKGEWIAFLDSDDLWVENKLELQLDSADKNPEVDLIFTDGYIFENEDKNTRKPYGIISGIFQGKEMYVLLYERNWVPVLSVLVRKSIVDKVGLQDEHPYIHYGCEDFDYWLRMAKNGAVFLGLSEKLFYYRRHSNNMSRNVQNIFFAEYYTFLKNLDTNVISPNLISWKIRNYMKPLVNELIVSRRFQEACFLSDKIQQYNPSLINRIQNRVNIYFENKSPNTLILIAGLRIATTKTMKFAKRLVKKLLRM
jgi:teichuronic acid biosynthesis glycosyltransferase TuaG